MSNDSPIMFLAASITFWAHLGLVLGVGTGSSSGSYWTSYSIPKIDSTWSSASDYESEALMETLSYAKGLDIINLPSLWNG